MGAGKKSTVDMDLLLNAPKFLWWSPNLQCEQQDMQMGLGAYLDETIAEDSLRRDCTDSFLLLLCEHARASSHQQARKSIPPEAQEPASLPRSSWAPEPQEGNACGLNGPASDIFSHSLRSADMVKQPLNCPFPSLSG